MTSSINLFGNGYVGHNFAKKYSCVINSKHDLVPKLEPDVKNILYLISTIDNYTMKVNPYLDIETNLTTLVRVLENFRSLNRPDVVFNFASSWFVYGDTDLPASEESYCKPKGFYSITKRTAEELLVSYCETYGLKYRILRFANIVGGDDPKASPKKNALTHLLKQLLEDKPINLYEGGDFFRDYIHVDDLITAVDLVINEGKVNTIYNIGNGVPISFGTIIDYAVTKYNSKSIIASVPQAPFHKIVQVKSMFMKTDKLKKLGYKPTKTVYDFVDELNDKFK